MDVATSQTFGVNLDNGAALEQLIRRSKIRLEMLDDERPDPARYRLGELRSRNNGNGPTMLALTQIRPPESLGGLVRMLGTHGVTQQRHATFRDMLFSATTLEAPRPECAHCTGWQVLVLEPNVWVRDLQRESEFIPTVVLLTDVPTWPTIRLMLKNDLSAVLGNRSTHVLLHA